MYRTTLSEESIDYIEQQVEQGNTNKAEIARYLIQNFNEQGTFNAVRKRVQYLIDQMDIEIDRLGEETDEAIKELKKNVKEKPPKYELYHIDGIDYFRVFYTKIDGITGDEVKIPVQIPIEDINGKGLIDICHDYSRKGGDLSQDEIMKKYKLPPQVRQTIKTAIPLYKTSEPTPDIVLKIRADNHSEEEVEKRLERQAERGLDKYRKKEQRLRERAKEREMEKALKLLYNFEYRLEIVKEAIVGLEPLKPPKLIKKHPEEIEETLTVAFSDLHLGENTSDVITNIQKMTLDICNEKHKFVNLLCLGDLVETIVTGGMHIGQIERMDGKYGIQLVREAVRILERMVRTLEEHGKVVSFHGLGGNHDRIGKRQEEDPAQTGALIIYEMMMLRLQDMQAKVHIYEDRVNKLIIGNTEYVFAHGEGGFASRAERRPTEVLRENGGKQVKNTVVIYGHLHSLKQENPSKGSHIIRLPAINPGGSYAKDINKSANSGYVTIEDMQRLRFTTNYFE